MDVDGLDTLFSVGPPPDEPLELDIEHDPEGAGAFEDGGEDEEGEGDKSVTDISIISEPDADGELAPEPDSPFREFRVGDEVRVVLLLPHLDGA